MFCNSIRSADLLYWNKPAVALSRRPLLNYLVCYLVLFVVFMGYATSDLNGDRIASSRDISYDCHQPMEESHVKIIGLVYTQMCDGNQRRSYTLISFIHHQNVHKLQLNDFRFICIV